MLLLSGPSGSGKTARILDGLRDALRRKDSGVRLLVPTATMVQHAQNQMAREGFVFKPGLIQTLSRFVEPWAEDLPQASSAVLNLMVEETVVKLNRKEFSKVAHLRGFYSSLARTIEEFSSAGCDARRLSAHLPDVPFAEGFLAVYREVERALERRGLAMRPSVCDEWPTGSIRKDYQPSTPFGWMDSMLFPIPNCALLRPWRVTRSLP